MKIVIADLLRNLQQFISRHCGQDLQSRRKAFIKRQQRLRSKPVMAGIVFLFCAALFLGGCSANMSKYYGDLRKDITNKDYKAAAKLVENQKSEYGEKNSLMFYLDSGAVNYYDANFENSKKSFEIAKRVFDERYTKSISAGAASMIFNDSTMPYYGENFERAYITVFQSLNFISQGGDNEAAVEARQVDTLFKFFTSEKGSYTEDAFIRYFMGLVYENAGYLNDAHISYSLALSAYGRDGSRKFGPPQDLIDDAYTSALRLKMNDKAASVKNLYPSAKSNIIPSGSGELIIVDFNGIIPEKIETIFEIAFTQALLYVNASNVDDNDMRAYQNAKSAGLSAFSSDYIKVSFPKYKPIKHTVNSFSVDSKHGGAKSYLASDLGDIAQNTLSAQIAKIYAKTIARAVIKYIAGKQASDQVKKSSGSGWGMLAQIAANTFNSLSETADLRAWNTLPENILMARLFLPQGRNTITIKYIGANGAVVGSEAMLIDIKANKKNFLILKTPS
ncbi:MAG: hypothetical protein LBV16_04840 [Elusimicrobiota bacterium]|nr:hypothetical protein [Elusimicrobiota bacterium]